jgi:hypothetical protein
MQDGSQKDGSSLRLGGWNATEGLLLEQKFAIAVFESMKSRQVGKPEQIVAQRIIRQHERGDVAKFQAADLDHIKPGGRRSDRSVGGLHLSDKRVARWMNTEPRGVARRQGNDRRTRIDHEGDAAAIDPAIDVKMALGVARNHDRSQTRVHGRSWRQRVRLWRRGCGRRKADA